jgi:hypothetical protein
MVKGWKNLPHILSAILTTIRWKVGLLTEEEKQEIRNRREICYSCPFNSTNAVSKGIYETDRIDLHCMHCGCIIDLVTKCLDCNCGLEEFNKEKNLNIPLKWLSMKY